MFDVVAARPCGVGGFLAGIVEAVLAARRAVQVNQHGEVGGGGPFYRFVEVSGGAGDEGVCGCFLEGPVCYSLISIGGRGGQGRRGHGGLTANRYANVIEPCVCDSGDVVLCNEGLPMLLELTLRVRVLLAECVFIDICVALEERRCDPRFENQPASQIHSFDRPLVPYAPVEA